jgi:aspartoacylase
MIKNITIFGATHGNEWTGRAIIDNAKMLQVNNHYKLNFELANLEAIKLARRFVEMDLNRSFAHLNEENNQLLEAKLARNLALKIKDNQTDFLIDLHTTTSNMGITLIITELNQFNCGVCFQVKKMNPEVKILYAPDPTKKYLISQANHGLMIEVGPVAQALYDARIIFQTKDVLEQILKLDLNQEQKDFELSYFEELEDFYYPEKFFIHPKFQNSDWQLLKKGKPIFINLAGEEIMWDKADCYPIFINEAAYYDRNLAFSTTQLKTISF